MAGDFIVGCVAFCICALTVGFTVLAVAGVANMTIDVVREVKAKFKVEGVLDKAE